MTLAGLPQVGLVIKFPGGITIAKYGIENFKKEILFVFDNEVDMNAKEKELVTICEQSYNLCPGGNGGFSYINESGINKFKGKKHTEKTKKKISESRTGSKLSLETLKKLSDMNARTNASRGEKTSKALKGRPKTEEHKKKISESVKKKHLEKKCGNGASGNMTGFHPVVSGSIPDCRSKF